MLKSLDPWNWRGSRCVLDLVNSGQWSIFKRDVTSSAEIGILASNSLPRRLSDLETLSASVEVLEQLMGE